jgi:hypothetical protein
MRPPEPGLSLPNLYEVRDAVSRALANLQHDDADLFRLGVSERALVGALRGHLERELQGWHIDVEYNRHGNAPKYLRAYRALLSEAGLDAPDRDYPITPDLVVHVRGTDKFNLLAMEVKKISNRQDRQYDHLKLQALREELRYRYTVMIEFDDVRDPGRIAAQDWQPLAPDEDRE